MSFDIFMQVCCSNVKINIRKENNSEVNLFCLRKFKIRFVRDYLRIKKFVHRQILNLESLKKISLIFKTKKRTISCNLAFHFITSSRADLNVLLFYSNKL